MALVLLPMKFGADIFVQSGVIDILSKIKHGGCRHLGFLWVSHGIIIIIIIIITDIS